MLLASFFKRLIQRGRLTLIDARNRVYEFGDDALRELPAVTVKLHDRALEWRLLVNAPLHLGEAYMDGTLTVEQGTLADFLELLLANQMTAPPGPLEGLGARTRFLLRRLRQHNPIRRARHNVAHHYDLSQRLYRLFLDDDLQYSCAYFANTRDTLETAQLQKKAHIASKLALAPKHRVLDIGSGWGGLDLYLHREAGVEVAGITLSEEQLRVAQSRAMEAHVEQHVRFLLEDYRALEGTYDRIVSVGMFEHVGVGHYADFFANIAKLLTDDGVALIHTIGRSDGPGATQPWIEKYIFPGGYTPALSEILPAIERAGLIVCDVEVLRLHYAETLKAWRARLYRNWREIAAIYDERFCRMWEFYLAGAEMGFRHQGLVVFQLQLAKSINALPVTRDYMASWEHAHAATTASRAPRVRRHA